MTEKTKKIVKSFKSKYILAIAFLFFIFYVGCAAFPLALINFGDRFKNGVDEESILKIIKSLNEQYNSMLDTKLDQPTLQNQSFYINLNGGMSKILGQQYVNERVKLTNGHLSTLTKKTNNIDCSKLVDLYLAQKNNGKLFLFVLAPTQISKYNSQLPNGYTAYGNENADRFIAELQKNAVPILDLRDKLYEQNISHDDIFFVTDHHWNLRGGFWAYNEIMKYLVAEKYIESVDMKYTDINNYEILRYDKVELGSSGKRTGQYFAGMDDVEILIPKFDTNLSLEITSKQIFNSGRFEEVAYKKDFLDDINYFNSSKYTVYGYGNNDYAVWRNENAEIDLKIMMIGDSFGNIPFSFLPLYFSKCDELDMRSYTEDFRTYYEEYNPDIIIVLINPSEINGENTKYDFFGQKN